MCVHAEPAHFVSIHDGVGDPGFGITAGRVDTQDLGSRGDVLRDGCGVIAPLEDGRVVVEVEDGYGDRAGGGQGAGPATVRGTSSEGVRRSDLAVEGCGQAEYPGMLVD